MSPRFPFSPRVRRSPYFEATVRHGATQFSVYNGMYLPMGYADGETEFWSLVRGVTLWDVAVQRIVEITGPDALPFTSRLSPRNLTRCAVGQCMYVVVTAEDGGILNDPLLLRLEESRSKPGAGLGLSLVLSPNSGSLELGDNDPGLRAELILPANGVDGDGARTVSATA